MARMVIEVMPPGIPDPAQHLIASEAAENGIRYVLRIATAVLTGLVLLIIAAGLAYEYVPNRGAHRVSEAAEAAGNLSASNAILRLSAANDSLQNQIANVTRERETVRSKLADVEKQVTSLRVRLDAALTAATRWEKQAREYEAREISRGMAARGK